MHRELEVPISLQQGFLGKKEAFAEAPAPCVLGDEAVPVISWITGGEVVGTFF